MGAGEDVFDILYAETDDMSVAVIIVGIDDWEKYTLPCINSIKACEPKAKIIYIDNGSDEPYPNVEGTVPIGITGTVCYAEAINIGLASASGIANWYLVCNNDVLFKKPFVSKVNKLDTERLHGFEKHTYEESIEYICGWSFLISSQVIDKVGLFDEHFKPKWYEDVDYCIRAKNADVAIEFHNPEGWGFKHLKQDEERDEIRSANMKAYRENHNYLKAKHGLE